MSTLSTPPQGTWIGPPAAAPDSEQATIAAMQAQIAALEAKIADYEKPGRIARFFAPVSNWVASHQGWAHVAASTWGTLVLGYSFVPEFQQFVNGLYADMPHWAHRALTGIIPLVIWYKKTQKQQPAPAQE